MALRQSFAPLGVLPTLSHMSIIRPQSSLVLCSFVAFSTSCSKGLEAKSGISTAAARPRCVASPRAGPQERGAQDGGGGCEGHRGRLGPQPAGAPRPSVPALGRQPRRQGVHRAALRDSEAGEPRLPHPHPRVLRRAAPAVGAVRVWQGEKRVTA